MRGGPLIRPRVGDLKGIPREVQSKETYRYVVIYRCICVTRLALAGVGVLISHIHL